MQADVPTVTFVRRWADVCLDNINEPTIEELPDRLLTTGKIDPLVKIVSGIPELVLNGFAGFAIEALSPPVRQ
jgi:hypothetical protein